METCFARIFLYCCYGTFYGFLARSVVVSMRQIYVSRETRNSMDSSPLTATDTTLIEHASEINERAFDPDFFDGAHIVAAAIRTTNGDMFSGVSLPANTGRASTCGEPVAIGSAIAAGNRYDQIETCVAVEHPMPYKEIDEPSVIPPCGTCRELLADYGEDIRIIVPVDGENRGARAIDLLPTRTW